MTDFELIQEIVFRNLLPEVVKQMSDKLLKDTLIARGQEPSLPSNMDEAGAEWMAGQGEMHELTVESPVLGPTMICCPVRADNGDKVIVQIRKKEK